MSTTEQATAIPTGTWQHERGPFEHQLRRDAQHGRNLRGQFAEWQATLENGHLEGSADVSSVRVEDENLVGHLQSPDFFDAEQFPKLRFVSDSIERHGDEVRVIVGDLTVKGSTEPVELSGRMSGPITDGFGNERIGLDLETVINRHAFGVSWNADLPGGGRMLEDDVTITANLTLIRK